MEVVCLPDLAHTKQTGTSNLGCASGGEPCLGSPPPLAHLQRLWHPHILPPPPAPAHMHTRHPPGQAHQHFINWVPYGVGRAETEHSIDGVPVAGGGVLASGAPRPQLKQASWERAHKHAQTQTHANQPTNPHTTHTHTPTFTHTHHRHHHHHHHHHTSCWQHGLHTHTHTTTHTAGSMVFTHTPPPLILLAAWSSHTHHHTSC